MSTATERTALLAETVSVSNAIPLDSHEQVRKVVRLAAGWALDEHVRKWVHVNVKRSGPGKSFANGRAYNGVPGMARVPAVWDRQGCEVRYLVTMMLPWPVLRGERRFVDGRTPGVEPWVFDGGWEGFFLLAVHEMLHVDQFHRQRVWDGLPADRWGRPPRPRVSEADCNRKAMVALTELRGCIGGYGVEMVEG